MDHDSFLSYYDECFPKVYSFIFFRTRDKAISEDLTSQTFLKAFEKLHKYDPEKAAFKTWLYQIARNTLIDHYRQRHSYQDLESAHTVKDDASDIIKAILSEEAEEEIRQALWKLPELEREVLLLRLWEDLSYKEIAAILGKTESSLRIIACRALKKLKASLSHLALTLLLFILS